MRRVLFVLKRGRTIFEIDMKIKPLWKWLERIILKLRYSQVGIEIKVLTLINTSFSREPSFLEFKNNALIDTCNLTNKLFQELNLLI